MPILFKTQLIEKITPKGGTIRKKRLNLHIGLRECARRARCSPAHLSRIEHGQVDHISRPLAVRISLILGCKQF